MMEKFEKDEFYEFTKTSRPSMEIDPFVTILEDGNLTNHYLAKGMELDGPPSSSDIVAHLKLLRAFALLKQKVTNGRFDQQSTKLWQVYVTNAVRRFIVFISAIRKDMSINKTCLSQFRNQSPPLDILLVWHSASLNPKAYYDFLVRNNFIEFHAHSFPLDLICQAIDNTTFEYVPQKRQRESYTLLISKFSGVKNDLEYEGKLDATQLTCDIQCPICLGLVLVNVPYTNKEGTGFADARFKQSKAKLEKNGCNCNYGSSITHTYLRLRQLQADLEKPYALPNTHRYYSETYKRDHYLEEAVGILDNIKHQIKQELQFHAKVCHLEPSIHFTIASAPHLTAKTYILRQYLQMNLIHLTVKDGMEVLEDLVGAVMRQERFWMEINKMKWLNSPLLPYSLTRGVERYVRFLDLLTKLENRGNLVPTLDIALVWNTHQLLQKKYLEDTTRITGGVAIEHDDKVDEAMLDGAFDYTCKVWQRTFGEDYTCCPCWYCKQMKERYKKIGSWFKTPRGGSKFYLMQELGEFTHINVNDAIEVPTPSSIKMAKALKEKYKYKVFPWEKGYFNLSFALYPNTFVIAPLTPYDYKSRHYYQKQLHPDIIYGDKGAQRKVCTFPAPSASEGSYSYCQNFETHSKYSSYSPSTNGFSGATKGGYYTGWFATGTHDGAYGGGGNKIYTPSFMGASDGGNSRGGYAEFGEFL